MATKEDSQMIGLRLSCACMPNDDQRHPQKVMSDLGIKYADCVPNMAAESWKFYGIDPATLPKELPSFLTIISDDPSVAIGQRAREIERRIADRKMFNQIFHEGKS